MKKLLASCCMLMVFLGNCSSIQPADVSIPTPVPSATRASTPTASPYPKWTSTSVVGTSTAPTTPTTESTVSPTPLPNVREAQILSITMKDETSGWAWARDNAYIFYLLHTSDGGLKWKDVTPDKTTGLTYFLTGQSAWAATSNPSNARSATLMHTTDGGISWTTINQDMQNIDTYPYSSAFGFEDEENGWWRTAWVGAGSAHIYYFQTRDGGMTWEKVAINISKNMISDYYIESNEYGEIKICNICGAFFYFDLSRVIFSPGEWSPTIMWITKDVGTIWKKIELSSLPNDINPEASPIRYPTFFNDQEGALPFIVNDPNIAQLYIFGTQDNGATWNLESRPLMIDKKKNNLLTTTFVSRLDVFVGFEQNLSVTHDGGNTWTQSAWPQGFTSSETEYIEPQINFVSPTTGWILLRKFPRSGGRIAKSIFLKTTDGGLTWTEIVPVINP